MVKHQRRSHQRGIHSSELDDCTSDSGSEDSPSTPRSGAISWPTPGIAMAGGHGPGLHRAASFADFGQHMSSYGMPQQYAHRHSLSSDGGAPEYHGLPSAGQAPMNTNGQVQQQHQHQHQQHPGVQMLQRNPSIPQHPYYVTEQNNPGVATMNTTAHHPTQGAPMQPQYHHQVPRQGVERLPLEIPYNAGAPGGGGGGGGGMNASLQSSPSTFSAASSRSPNMQDGFYTHAPAAAQAATYALHGASPVDQQPPQMVAYQGHQMPQAQQLGHHHHHQPQQQQSQPQAPPPQHVVHQQQQQGQQQPQSAPQQHAQCQSPHQYQPPQAVQTDEQAWYAAAAVPAYQPPVVEVVTTLHQLPTYGSTVYDPWGAPKLDYDDDPTMQMPSARIETM